MPTLSTPNFGVLLLGDYRQTLTVLRSLSRAGYRTVVGYEDMPGATARSRHTDALWHHPPMEPQSADQFFAALSDCLAANPDIRCVFPIGEPQISYLMKHRHQLPDSVAYAMPSRPSFAACLDKVGMFAQLRNLDIPCANYRTFDDRSGFISAIEAVGLPCVVKPQTEQELILGSKALVLRDRSNLEKVLGHWPGGRLPCIVQSYVEGPRHNVYFFAERGVRRASVEVTIERTDRLDGTGYAVEGRSVVSDPVLIEYTDRLIRRLEYTGAGCAQFLVDQEQERTTFLEVNARLGANFAIAYHCGLDLPKWWVESALGHSSAINANPPTEDVHYAWLYGDLQGWKRALLSREASLNELVTWLYQMIRSSIRTDVHVTWDRRDPLPAVWNMAQIVISPLHRVVRCGLSSFAARIRRVFRATPNNQPA